MGGKIIRSLILITLLVIYSYIVAGAIYDRGWSIPQTILPKTYKSNFPSIAGGPDGSWHMVYGTELYHESTETYTSSIEYLNNNSEHYTIDQKICNYAEGECDYVVVPSIDIGPDGRIHVVYGHIKCYAVGDEDNVTYECKTQFKYMYRGGRWSIPQTILSETYTNINFPSIAGGPDGSWHMVYGTELYHEGTETSTSSIEYLNNNSEHYTIDQKICNYAEGECDYVVVPSIDIGPDGRIHVVYEYGGSAGSAFKYMYREGITGKWSIPQTILSETYTNINFPSIAGGPDGSWHMVYGTELYHEGTETSTSSIEYLNSNSEHYTITQARHSYATSQGSGVLKPSIDMGPDERLHVVYGHIKCYAVGDEEYECKTQFKYMNKRTDKLRLLIIPINWKGSYASFKTKANQISQYYLERIPLKDCPEQFEVLISEQENYGYGWSGWSCYDSGLNINPNCNNRHTLQKIAICAAQYKKRTTRSYDYVVGITDKDICGTVAGWSQGGILSVIAESNVSGVVTHELGHKFGLADQYCDCSPVLHDANPSNDYLASYCGPTASINPLKPTLGCDTSTCCWGYGTGRYDPACGWCHGNYDTKGTQRTVMSNKYLYPPPNYETGYHDINEYAHLKTIPQFKCDSSKVSKSTLTTMSSNSNNSPTSVYSDSLLTVSLIVFNNDTVEAGGIDVSFGYTPIIYPQEGDYSLRVLDMNNNTLYSRNMSLDFILFSDPPEIVDYSYIYDKIPFDNSMNRIELYHDENLIFSQELDFCNYNHSCDENENYYSCPSDCLPYEEDGICNNEEYGGCDIDCLAGIDPDCSIFLQPGWNLISIPFNISNKTAEWLCNQVNCSSIFAFYNPIWKYYYPAQSVNTLDGFDETKGLWIKVNNSSELSLEGSSFEKAEINLMQGWNLIGYPMLYTSSINKTLNETNFSEVYTYKDNEWYSYVKGRDDSLNGLESFTPGYGYWVYSNNATTITLS